MTATSGRKLTYVWELDALLNEEDGYVVANLIVEISIMDITRQIQRLTISQLPSSV